MKKWEISLLGGLIGFVAIFLYIIFMESCEDKKVIQTLALISLLGFTIKIIFSESFIEKVPFSLMVLVSIILFIFP